GFLLENFEENDADIVAMARLKQDTLITIHRAMAEIANRNIYAILQDTIVFDREALNGWYNRINTQTAKYSLVNSYFEVGEYALARQELAAIPQRFALTTDELAEYDNFCQYQSLRESVYSSGRNYAQLTEDEIAELQRIVERNTGVSSAYANSVLCFFYGICHDEEIDIDFDIDAPMNSKSTTEVVEENAEPLAIYVYPNPADEDLNILLNSLPEGRTMIEFHDVAGRLVLSEEIKSANTSINISSLKQGVYMYRIVNGDSVIARDRIVKE
ncbi:MAG: T9SS type A sorting domain-containing protein, partial [Bacteroidales bacterium]|nr:T9SS type A sorting domain-containing protein [Bacteroidales bacterium]